MREAAAQPGVACVNLYQATATDPFVQEAERLHPGDERYAVWLDELLARAPLRQALAGRQ